MQYLVDAGMGGVINKDPIGLGTIYSPTKRYTAKTVDHSAQQAFQGP